MKHDSGLTPMMQQYLEIKRDCADAVLFYRMGDFYEMFHDDAVVASRLLGIALTTRDKGKENPVPMCGVPYHSASSYISRLIRAGHKVAVCEQAEAPSAAKGLVRREVVRIITPGLVVEDDHLVRDRANYLMAVCSSLKNGRYGVAYIDISTGDFRATELQTREDLIAEMFRVGPSEVVTAEPGLVPDGFLVSPVGLPLSAHRAQQLLSAHFGTVTMDGFGLKDSEDALRASGMVLEYVKHHSKAVLPHITSLTLYNPGRFMMLGPTTKRNLELFDTISGRSENTLFALLNHTGTPMGSRMLADWISFPLMDVRAITARLDAVEALLSREAVLNGLREVLKDIPDLERIIGRICAGSAGPRDMRSLAEGLGEVPRIRALVEGVEAPLLMELCQGLHPLGELRERIDRTMVEAPPLRLTDGNVIAAGVDAELDELRELRRDSRQWIAALEAREREATGVGTLKIGYNKVFGYYIELTKANAARAPETYIRKQTLVNAERYITPELKEYEARLLGAQDAIAAIEQRIFFELKDAVIPHVEELKSTALSLAGLDVLASLARVALLNAYVKPEVVPGRGIEIVSGRHPVVEKVLRPGEFVPNTSTFDAQRDTIHIITGPNMAGKSTYMRQVALICLMAQMGSFVPASRACIGMVDRIFTRIGALDNLSAGQSTFLVEMSETADILRNATAQSLVILDEIGRGTSTYDGMALAWAVAEYLDDRGIRTFFATHYHELADLSRRRKGIRNYHLAVEETPNEVVFLRTLKRGAIGRSFGIYVARLAGIPDEVVDKARVILAAVSAKARTMPAVQGSVPVQASLFEEGVDPVTREILNIDPDSLTPLQALNLLHSLREKITKTSPS
jgi:DNA mismatch repair protein MutS